MCSTGMREQERETIKKGLLVRADALMTSSKKASVSFFQLDGS